MMSYEGYQDRTLICRDCGREFTFTAGEQAFFAGKGFTNDPTRCPDCRAARRSGGGSRSTAPRAQYDAICASCGQPTTVPFMPREDRPVYCNDCFQSQRPARPPREYSRSGGGGGRDRRSRDRYDRW